MEVDRVLADPDPQPGAARPAALAERLDAPGRLVALAQPRLALVRLDGGRERLEQRRETPRAVGQRPRRDRQPLAGQPVGDPVEGPKTRIALVQEPRPHADPVGRVREQARHRRRRDFRRRGGAIATSAPARPRDHARVRLDGHLDQFRRVGAVRHIQFPAIGADALVRRGVVNFRALFETRPGRATMAGGAGLLAARTVRPRPLPALALAPEPRLGMHRPIRAKLRKLRLKLPDTGSPGLDLQAQRGDRAPLARIHARFRQQPLQPPDLGAQRQRLPRRAANLPHLGPRRRQLVPTDLELPPPAPRLGAPADLAAAQFLRPPPLALEQRPPVRFPACRRGRPASLREGRTGSKLPNRGQDRPQDLCWKRHAHKNNACRRPLPALPALRHRNRRTE